MTVYKNKVFCKCSQFTFDLYVSFIVCPPETEYCRIISCLQMKKQQSFTITLLYTYLAEIQWKLERKDCSKLYQLFKGLCSMQISGCCGNKIVKLSKSVLGFFDNNLTVVCLAFSILLKDRSAIAMLRS